MLFSIFGLYALLTIISDYIFSDTYYKSLAVFHNSISMSAYLTGFIITGYIIYRFKTIAADRFKYRLFLYILSVFAIHTFIEFIAFNTGLLYWPHQITTYLFPVYLIIFAVYSTVELIKKRKVRIRQSSQLTITDTCKEKLDYVIGFINANYNETISREGLAAAVNINPNYLSSLFNVYTGKNFNEYINILRIKEAANMLCDTNQKIIDIAFSVGFENQSTFIRIFKKEMGQTPSEYRLEKRSSN